MQYSGVNFCLFSNLREEVKYPLGRICEMIPYAVIGVLLYKINIEKLISNRRFLIIIFAIFLFGFSAYCMKNNLFIPIGFYYSGFPYILLTLSILIVGFSLNFIMKKQTIVKFIKIITNFTLGIYCMHLMVGKILLTIISILGFESYIYGMYSLVFCIVVYIICYFLCYLINLIPNRFTKMLVS